MELGKAGDDVKSIIHALSIVIPYLLWWLFFGVPEGTSLYGEMTQAEALAALRAKPLDCTKAISVSLPGIYWGIGVLIVPWVLLRQRIVGLVIVGGLNLWALSDTMFATLPEYYCSPGVIEPLKRSEHPTGGTVLLAIIFLIALTIALSAAYRYWRARYGDSGQVS